MADSKMETYGSVVAFEGHPDIISTQLRLLPTSPQILILPTVQSYLPSDDLEQAFEVRAYIRKIHDALAIRHETARNFLQGSTATSKRLVFMNGGTPSAQALCIKAIMKHETGGDRVEAEAFFTQLVKDGLAGLDNQGKVHESVSSSGYAGDEELDDELQDPITRAMRAADALDRQTANLQPCDMLDLTMTTRPRSLSLPLYGYSDGFGDAAPFFLFGAHCDDDSDGETEEPPAVPGAPTFSVIDYNQPAKRTRLDSLVDPPPTSPSCIGESYNPSALRLRRDTEILSPTSDVFSIRTNDNVVYGEAALLDMRLSLSVSKGALARIKSLDRIYPISPKFRDLCIPTGSIDAGAEPVAPRRPHSFMVITDQKDPASRRLSHIERPRTIIVKPRRHTVKVDAVPMDKKHRKKRNTIRASYVDRGTDAVPPKEASFQPVLPCVEDLVVYFKDETTDVLLCSVVNAFKTGNYPVVLHSKIGSVSETNFSTPATPQYQPPPVPDLGNTIKEQSVLNIDDDDYDPYAYSQSPWQSPKGEQTIPTVTIVRPPTPAQTPPPYTEKEEKFHEFEIAPAQTAVAIQNSLRSILSDYFPPEAEGYRQFQFSLLPEFDGLWKPVFRESESRGSQMEHKRRVDQILAIGSQQGVKKEYSSGIIKQLEKHGTKSSDDQGRSGRVDFRYLLANAMQSFTAQPLQNQTSNNPFTNSYLLATLIIPHLETYLALHSEIRYLLLEYPPEHLPTMLALQKLIGVDLIKVAQIVDSSNKDRLPFTQIGGPNVGKKSENKTPTISPRSSNSDITVSNANFLLTSTATDADIAKFVSTVWNIQADASDSDGSIRYSHDKLLRKKKAKPAPLNASFTPFPRSSVSSHSALSPTSAGSPTIPASPTMSSRTPSFVENIKTLKSEGVKHGRTLSRRRFFHRNSTSMSTTINNPDSEDSELDMEERRLMPMFMQKPSDRKGNTRKALKFLGLA